jgi:hypothetical protein
MQTITANELEKKFDNGEDVSEYMDFSKVQKLTILLKQQSDEYEEVKISFPKKFIQVIDEKVKDIGVNREAFIKMLIAQRLNFDVNHTTIH